MTRRGYPTSDRTCVGPDPLGEDAGTVLIIALAAAAGWLLLSLPLALATGRALARGWEPESELARSGRDSVAGR